MFRRAMVIAGLLAWVGALATRAAAPLAPANPFIIDTWDTDRGLPQNSVFSILQARDGYLWFGTFNGLVRFDGNRFEVFDESNTPGLESGRVVKLFEDRQGRLWVGTESAGIVLIKDGEAIPQGIGQGTPEKRLVAAAEDTQGDVWLAGANGELWRHAQGRWNPYLQGFGALGAVRHLAQEPGGPLWIGHDNNLVYLSAAPESASMELAMQPGLAVRKLDYLVAGRKEGYWRLADRTIQKFRGTTLTRDLGPYLWGFEGVSAAVEDAEGNLVVGTVGAGVFWYNATGGVTRITTALGLAHNNVFALAFDREGSLWVGTDGGGISRVKPRRFEVLEVALDAQNTGGAVQSLCADKAGGLWIGANNGGASYWKDGSLQRFGRDQGLMNPYVWSVLVDREGQVWADTRVVGLFQMPRQGGGFQRANAPPVAHREAHALMQDRAGRLWVGTQGGLACLDQGQWLAFGPEQGFAAGAVQALAEDREGALWVGTANDGLYRLQAGRFTRLGKNEGLPGDHVSALLADADGVLWVGTSGSGLGRFAQGRWTTFTKRDGLLSDNINYLADDPQGCLWIGSFVGLLRIAKQPMSDFAAGKASNFVCRAYGKADGLPTRECTWGSQPAVARTPDGRLWFPTIKGVVGINPAALSPNPHRPPVVIESVLVDGQSQDTNRLRAFGTNLVLMPAGRERLEIHFTSLNLGAGDRAQFRYRLGNHESAWADGSASRSAIYTKLPPGAYHFQVIAANEDGVWNEDGARLEVQVLPPFYRTWWFLTLAATGLLGAVAGAVYYASTKKLQRQVERLRQQEALQHDRARIARDLHDQLGASLTQIALLGELAEADKEIPAEVEGHAKQISRAARDTTRVLDEIVWAVNPANDTMEGLVNYLCKYAQEYLAVGGVRYRLEAPAQLPARPLPPDVRHHFFLAGKEAVTNVVRHARATEAHLRVSVDDQGFTLEIEDNGRGVPPEIVTQRNGLKNMRLRMESIGGTFDIGSAGEKGARVRLRVPWPKT
jgi:ligand-binding sensor domain-containing protein/signal transduction histidine kinase